MWVPIESAEQVAEVSLEMPGERRVQDKTSRIPRAPRHNAGADRHAINLINERLSTYHFRLFLEGSNSRVVFSVSEIRTEGGPTHIDYTNFNLRCEQR